MNISLHKTKRNKLVYGYVIWKDIINDNLHCRLFVLLKFGEGEELYDFHDVSKTIFADIAFDIGHRSADFAISSYLKCFSYRGVKFKIIKIDYCVTNFFNSEYVI